MYEQNDWTKYIVLDDTTDFTRHIEIDVSNINFEANNLSAYEYNISDDAALQVVSTQ